MPGKVLEDRLLKHPLPLRHVCVLIAVCLPIILESQSVRPNTTPSTISLNSLTWTPIGPAPTVNLLTDYVEAASGRVAALAADPVDPNVIFLAAAGGGVWKTADAGVTWSPLTDTQSTLFMGAIAIAPSAPSTIYAGTGEANMGPSKTRNSRDNIYYGRGILKSSNGGSTWTLVGTDVFSRRTISKIVVDPTDPNTVFAAIGALATNGLADNTGIWKSSNGGVTWTNTTASISTVAAYSDVAMDPADNLTLYAAVGTPGIEPSRTANGVYKTTDGGASWARAGDFPSGEADTLVGRISLGMSAAVSGTVYAAIARPGPPLSNVNSLYRIMKTVDGGANWSPTADPGPICPESGQNLNYLASSGDYHNVLGVDPVDAAIVYAAGLCLIRSSDGGQSWSAIATGETEGPHRDHHALAFDAAGRLLNGNDGGAWRLEDPAALTWANLNTNLQITQFIGIALHPTNPDVAYGGTQDTGTARFQGTLQWQRLLRGDGGVDAVSTSDPNRVYQITRIAASSPNFFRRSGNGGNTWSIKVSGIDPADPKNFYPPFVMDPANSSRLLLGTNRVYESTNGADLWSPISAPGSGGWTAGDNIDAVAAAPSDINTLYATAGGHVFVTTDRGSSWQQRDVPGLADAHFRALLVDPSNSLNAYAVRDRFGSGHVFRTNNGGQTWSDISGDLPDVPANTIVADLAANVLYVGTDAGVYTSSNGGAQWVMFRQGLPNAQIVELRLNPALNILAAGTHGRGVWEILIQ
jgi:photosystem II stability/assembly factor-like uncharacterized protein